jgi:hypothetical protein
MACGTVRVQSCSNVWLSKTSCAWKDSASRRGEVCQLCPLNAICAPAACSFWICSRCSAPPAAYPPARYLAREGSRYAVELHNGTTLPVGRTRVDAVPDRLV